MTTTSTIKIGIRGKMFVAIGAVAGLTLVAATVSGLYFSSIAGLLRDIADRELPLATNTFALATQAQAIASAAPALYNATSHEARKRELASLQEREKALAEQAAKIGAGEILAPS